MLNPNSWSDWGQMAEAVYLSPLQGRKDWTAHLVLTPTYPCSLWRRSDCHVCKMIPKDKASNLQFISAAGTGQTLETHTNTLPPPHTLTPLFESERLKIEVPNAITIAITLYLDFWEPLRNVGAWKGPYFLTHTRQRVELRKWILWGPILFRAGFPLWKATQWGHWKKVPLKLQLTKAGPMEDGAAFQKPEYSKWTSFRETWLWVFTLSTRQDMLNQPLRLWKWNFKQCFKYSDSDS